MRPRRSDSGWRLVAGLLVLASNLLALWWVWRAEWGIATLMVLFWAENLVAGVLYAVRMVALPGANVVHGLKLFMVPFFLFHYGAFAAIHAVFVWVMFVEGDARPWAMTGFASALLMAAVAAAWNAWVQHRSYRPPSLSDEQMRAQHHDPQLARRLGLPLMRLMAEPYFRVAILHVVLILGAWGSMLVGSLWFSALLLIGLKTAYEWASSQGWVDAMLGKAR